MADERFDQALHAFVSALDEDPDYETVDWEIEHGGERYGTLDDLVAALPEGDVAYGGFVDYETVADITDGDATTTSRLNGYPLAFKDDGVEVAGYIEQVSHLLDNYLHRDPSAGDAVRFHQVYPPFVSVSDAGDETAYDILLVTAEREMRPCDASRMRFPGSVVHASGTAAEGINGVVDTLRAAAPDELADAVAGDPADDTGDEPLPEMDAVDDADFAPYEVESFETAGAYIDRMRTIHDNVERMRDASDALDRFFKAWASRKEFDVVDDELYDAITVDDDEYAEVKQEAEAAVDRLADGQPDGGVLQVLQETDMAVKHEFPGAFRTDLRDADKAVHDALLEETYTTSYRTMENDLSSKSNNTAVELFVPVMNEKPDPFDLFGAANFIAAEGIDDYEGVLDTFAEIYQRQRNEAVQQAEEEQEFRQRHYR